jgi:nucleoside-diphosphate-sugar epimerase
MAKLETAIPKGSWILVTGANGLLGSHIVKQFLERGYKVRGTVRDLSKTQWLVQDVFKSYADNGDFELALVPDLAADHAFDEAIKGISAIAHVASIVNFDPDPNIVVTGTVAGTSSILEAALSEPSVKSLVYTSSFLAAVMPFPGNDAVVKQDSWNDFALEGAWAAPPYEPSRAPLVYAASKVAAEKAIWKFIEDRKPPFSVNTILPAGIIGEPFHKSQTENVAAWIKMLYLGETGMMGNIPASKSPLNKRSLVLHLRARTPYLECQE